MANMALICACLIVTLHVPHEGRGLVSRLFTGQGIGNIAVPYFFIASGFFVAGHMHGKVSDWWIGENKKRVKSLLIPYLFWNVFYWIFMNGLSIISARFGVSFGENLSGGVSLGLNPFELPQLSFLWFVRCLIVFVVILPMFLLFKRRIGGFIGVLGLFGLLVTIPEFLSKSADWHERFAKVAWMRGLFWYSIGVWLRWNPIRLCDLRGWVKIVVLLMAVFSWIGLSFLTNINMHSVLQTSLRNMVIAISLLSIWMLVPTSQWSNKLTSCAFPIFLTHSAIITLITGGYRLCGVKEYACNSGMMYCLTVALVIVLSMLFAMAMKKSRWIVKIAFGGR